MTSIHCRGCRGWFDKKLSACPSCGTERHPYNKFLRTAQLNSHLLDLKRAAA